MRFAMTARTIARVRAKGQMINDITAANIAKVIRYREGGEEQLEQMVEKFEKLEADGDEGITIPKVQKVYPRLEPSR